MTATATMPDTDQDAPPDRVRITPLVGEPETEQPPALDVPPSRLPHDAEREERELDFVLRMLYALGGSATYDELRTRVPAAMNRPENDQPRNLTPLTWALRRGTTDRVVAAEPDGWNTTYHLCDTGTARLGMPAKETDELRDLRELAQQLADGIDALINGEATGWAREQYAGISYKIAEIETAAGLAATRAGVAAHRHAYHERIDVAFHDLTRGR